MFRDKKKKPLCATIGTQMGNDSGVHNTVKQIFHEFCIGKKNTEQATHKIMDIVHQVSKDNIR